MKVDSKSNRFEAKTFFLKGFITKKLRGGKNALSPCKTGLNPDPAPWGAYRGCAPPTECLCPPNESCAPPSEDCAPKKLTGSGLLERKSRSKLVFIVD